MSKSTKSLGQQIKETREAANLTRRELVAIVPELKGEGDLLQLENNDKHVASYAKIEAVKAALKM